MSDIPTRHGIGGIAAADHEDTGIDLTPETLPRHMENLHATGIAGQAAALDDVVAQAKALLHELAAAGTGTADRLDAIERALVQMQGQVAQIEAALPQYSQAIHTLDARITAIGQQVARNVRLAVLEAAVKAKGTMDPAKNVMPIAREFLEFMEPTKPAVAPQDDAGPEPGTPTH